LEYFLTEQAINADPERGFQLKKRIEEIQEELKFLPNGTLNIDIFHLPKPTTALIGRKIELAQLTEAIKNPNKRLAIIVAAGGIGKSALTDEWLTQIAQENYYGKTRVFGWSFYSQGSHNTFTNSQPFFSAVLPFLGISEIPKDEIEKARLLARCLQQQPCLLILDELEPLQYAENLQSMNGELQDSALKEFIACFRQTAGKSFVLFSSRQPLMELKKWQSENYFVLPLETFSDEDGAELLLSFKKDDLKTPEIDATVEECKRVSQDLGGHALSLVLLAKLIIEYHKDVKGNIRYANELPPLTSAHGDSDAEKDSRHALRVLDYYDSLQDAASRCFLQLLGLFDRPMNAAEKAVLIANANHAEPLRALTPKQWQAVEQRLEKSGLLLGKKGTFERLEWDTHPIIRVYFGEKFKENHPEEFKQAHRVLFDYYQKLPEKEFPDTLEEMQPLYRAVVHGCLAEEHQQALNVYRKRILRINNNGLVEYYSRHKLGAHLQDLTVLSAFFISDWITPTYSKLSEANQAWLLLDVSFCLMSLGRLQEAIKPRIAGVDFYKKSKSWSFASTATQVLVSLYLPLGQIKEAISVAQQAIEYAGLGKNNNELIVNSCYLANTLYLKGDLNKAGKNFDYSDSLIKTIGYEFLTSLTSFWYCNFLFSINNDESIFSEIIERIEYNFSSINTLLDEALVILCLARVRAEELQNSLAESYFFQAIQKIQKANKIEYISPFYLYRADFYLTQNQLDSALADLNSAWEIIERCGMKLYAVDYLLIHGRYSLATADFNTALNHYEEAKQLIEETGYHLRDAELDLFAAKLRGQCGEEYRSANQGLYSYTADFYLQKAKTRIADIGQWGLTRVIERDFPNQA
jgi:hypothetical protein